MIVKLKELQTAEGYTCVSHSQVRSYLSCRRKWKLERVYARKYKDYFTIGKLVHAGVALYYNNIKNGTDHSISEELSAVAQQLLDESPCHEVEIMDSLRLAQQYVKNYISYAKLYDNFRPVEIEKEWIIELDETARTACKIIVDGVVEDSNGDLFILEHKTPARVEEEHLPVDTQVTLYAALVEGILGRPVKGIIYNMIRKKVPSVPKILVNGGLSSAAIDTTAEIYHAAIIDVYGSTAEAPQAVLDRYAQLSINKNEYIARRILCRTDAEKLEVLERFRTISAEIAHVKLSGTGVVPNPTRECGTMCDFKDLCVMTNNAVELPSPEAYANELLLRGEL